LKEKVGFSRRLYRKVLYRNIDKVYEIHFKQKQMPRNRKKVLDVGMGFGFDIIKKHRQGYDCYGIDNDKARVDKTRSMFKKNGVDATFRVGVATKIPFAANTFDEVICSHVIEHVPDDRKCLTEIYRVLKRGGKVYLRTPNIHNLHTKFHTGIGSKLPYTDRTHVREYEKDGLAKLFRDVGFKVKSVESYGFFPPFGLKLMMVVSHYLPWGQMMEYLGERFPKNSAEIRVRASK